MRSTNTREWTAERVMELRQTAMEVRSAILATSAVEEAMPHAGAWSRELDLALDRKHAAQDALTAALNPDVVLSLLDALEHERTRSRMYKEECSAAHGRITALEKYIRDTGGPR